MNPNQITDEAQTKFAQALERFKKDLNGLRTGRASSAMLDGVMVEAYGVPTPLNQVATVTAPEAQLIQISPFDPSNIQAISTAIRNNQALGLNPSDDGRIVRIPIPALTEDRRHDIAKQVGQRQEDCMVRLRGARHEALDAVNQLKKDKLVGEDEAKRLEKQVDDALTKVRLEVEAGAKAKETEIMNL
jgi:ribosome recycling factor